MIRYYDIAYVAKRLKVAQSAIRYWVGRFDLKIKKTQRDRYQFTPDDLLDLVEIHYLLYERKFTIDGAIQERADHNYTHEIATLLRAG